MNTEALRTSRAMLEARLHHLDLQLAALHRERTVIVDELYQQSGVSSPQKQENWSTLEKSPCAAGECPASSLLRVSRAYSPSNTVVCVGKDTIGGGRMQVIAGPCAVESEEQIGAVAAALQKQGIRFLRGGAFKPRTSPYDFQGLGEEGWILLRQAADAANLRVVSEVMSPHDVERAARYVDVLQVGSRNMQNYPLLKVLGEMKHPVLLKRGMAATLQEWLLAAEYIVGRGNSQVVLCERGIRTYERSTRNTLDISVIPLVKQESHLPVIVDVAHATGRRDILLPCAQASLAAGADGLMLEVHPNPAVARSDVQQQIDLPTFAAFMKALSME